MTSHAVKPSPKAKQVGLPNLGLSASKSELNKLLFLFKLPSLKYFVLQTANRLIQEESKPWPFPTNKQTGVSHHHLLLEPLQNLLTGVPPSIPAPRVHSTPSIQKGPLESISQSMSLHSSKPYNGPHGHRVKAQGSAMV